MNARYKHIILISLDNLRGDCVGDNKFRYFPSNLKNKFLNSLNYLDILSKKGIFFKKCFTAAPYTTASHASILTGFLPLHHGLFEYYNAEISKKTIFEIVSEMGWKTLLQTDFPIMLNKALGFTRGVDNYFVEDELSALQDLKKNIKDNTFSLFHFGGIHYPYGFHKLKFSGRDYRNKIIQLEEKYHVPLQKYPKDQLDETIRGKEDKELLFRYKNIIEKLYKNKNYEKLTSLYLEGIEYFLKHRFKPFMNKLLKSVKGEDYLIMIFGDHGEEWSDSSEGHYKSLSFGVLNVPLIVIGSRIKPKVVWENVRTIDIVPTIAKYIESDFEYRCDGKAIDLDGLSKLQKDTRISIAQTWLGFGKDNLRDHINKAVKFGRVKKKMETIKRGESAILDDFQLLRLYNKLRYKTFDGDLSYGKVPMSKQIHLKLSKILSEYNKGVTDIAKKTFLKDNLRQELRLLGYEV